MFSVVVYAKSGPLREALTGLIGEFAEVTPTADSVPTPRSGPACSHVVVAPVSDCTPEACGKLADDGWRVVLLAPVPREAERRRYMASGATSYVPMTVRSEELRGAVSSAAGVTR